MALAAGPQRFASELVRVTLVELATSEGGKSCPPAEKWLGALRAEAGRWKNFVPVAWLVIDWDRLDWPNRFASREATQREYAYAEAWDGGDVYMPCFARDGAEWRTCRDELAPIQATGAGWSSPQGRLQLADDPSWLRHESEAESPGGWLFPRAQRQIRDGRARSSRPTSRP